MMSKFIRTLGLLLALSCLRSGIAEAAGLLVADGGFGGVLEIEEHTVQVTFNNGIVVTEVQQTFRNLEDRQVEALYTFPVPQGASVADFTMWIDGREMIGEVVEKQRARRIYNSYKRRRIDPGLLEQADFKTFEMRIFPIGAGASQRVRIAYYQELDFDHDWATYVYPLRTASWKDIDSRVRGRFEFNLDVTSEVPITAVESPSHAAEFAIVRYSDNYYQASLESIAGDLHRDVVLTFKTERPTTGLDLAATRTPGEDGTFQLTLTAGEELEGEVAPMDFVFVVDASGSMGEDGKLPLSRGLVAAFLDQLDVTDRFEVIRFNAAPEPAFRTLRPVDPVARDQALHFLQAQPAHGITALEPAVELAYRYQSTGRALNLVIVSDGMTYRSDLVTLIRLIGRRPSATRVFCLGVGHEVDQGLLQQIADEAGGLADFISPETDFHRQARAFRHKLLRPAGTDLRIDVRDVGAYDLEPTPLPNLYHGSPIRIYGRYRKAGTARVRVRAKIDGERFDRVFELEFPDAESANPELERMWAWRRIESLRREARRQGPGHGVDEIIRLGEAYSIVTEHTSFLVLENDAEYRRWKIERHNAWRLGRDHRAQYQVRQRLRALRQASLQELGPLGQGLRIGKDGSRASTPAAASPPVIEDSTRTAPVPPTPPRKRQDLGFGEGSVPVDPASVLLAAVTLAGLIYANRQRG